MRKPRHKRGLGHHPSAGWGGRSIGFWNAPGYKKRRAASRPSKAMKVYYVCPICGGPHARADH